MKRFTLLSLLVLLCVAVGRAQTLSQLAPDEITAGKRIVLRGAAVNNIYYFNGGEANEGFADGMKVFVVEEAATEGKVVLRGEVSGEYVAKPSGAANANALVDATADKSGAAEFTVSAANYTGTDLTTDYTFEQAKLVRFVTSGTDGADTYLNTNSQGSKAKYFDGKGNWSVWAVYELPAGTNFSLYGDNLIPKISTDGDICYYVIRSYRSGKYLTYTGDSSNLMQSESLTGNASLWYFTADGVINGGLKVEIHNAATDNLLTSYDSFTAEGATWYVKPNPYNDNGFCISLNEALNAYNCLDATNDNSGVGYWQPSAGDNQGTTWQFVSVDELIAERLATLRPAFERAVGKGYVNAPSDKDLQTILTQMDDLEANPTFEGLAALNAAVAALQPAAENSPVDGALYRIQNYQRKTSTGNNPCNGEGGYIEPIDQLKPAHSVCKARALAAVDQDEASADALWQLQAAGDGTYRLYNPNSGFYMTQTDDSQEIKTLTTNADEAATFSFGTYEGVPGQSSIMCAERESVNNRYLHCSGNLNDGQDASARIMFYTAGANGPSAWYIRPAETINVELKQVGDEAWASAVLPVDVELTDDVKAYTGELEEADDVLRLTELTGTVPAGKPVVLAGTAGVKALRVSAAQAPVSVDKSGALKGTLRYVDVTDDTRDSYLILGIFNDAVGFYLPAEATTAIPGNKAYLDIAAGSAVRGYALSLGGATTGIEGVTAAGAESEAPLYDLSGRRVVNPTHGVYIRGGKKVYIK